MDGPLQREAFIAALVGVSATLGMDVLCSKVRVRARARGRVRARARARFRARGRVR